MKAKLPPVEAFAPFDVRAWQSSYGFFVQVETVERRVRLQLTHEDAMYLRKRLNECYVDLKPGISDADRPGEGEDGAEGT